MDINTAQGNRGLENLNKNLGPFSNLLSFLIKLFVTLLLAIGVFSLFGLYSNWIEKPGIISVSGEGSKMVKPDLVNMKVSFSNTADNSSQVISGNETLAKSLVSLLTAQGVAKEDVTIFNASLTPIQSGTALSFRASNDAEIKIKDLSKYKGILNALFSSQFGNISGVSFAVQNSSAPVESEVVDLAIKDAKEKAASLAKASGKRLGRLVSVTVNESGNTQRTIGVSSENDVAAPQEIEIKKSATLVYEIK